jgi:hypothetical protein
LQETTHDSLQFSSLAPYVEYGLATELTWQRLLSLAAWIPLSVSQTKLGLRRSRSTHYYQASDPQWQVNFHDFHDFHG